MREEVGVEFANPILTRIIHETVTDRERVCLGYFSQFTAAAKSTEIRAGHEVVEARWFDSLPSDMAFRDDYLDDFQKIRPATTF